jgi:hypothetical protein
MRAAFLLPGLFALLGCESMAGPEGDIPAVLIDGELEAVESAVAEAFERATLEVNYASGGRQLTVLPPRLGPYEDRSTAVPRTFEAVLRGGTCILLEEGGEMEIELPAGSCRAT